MKNVYQLIYNSILTKVMLVVVVVLLLNVYFDILGSQMLIKSLC